MAAGPEPCQAPKAASASSRTGHVFQVQVLEQVLSKASGRRKERETERQRERQRERGRRRRRRKVYSKLTQ